MRGGNCLCLGAQCSLQKAWMEEVRLEALKEELWPKGQMLVVLGFCGGILVAGEGLQG